MSEPPGGQLTAARLTAAIKAAICAHHEDDDLHGATQWYVSDIVIDCDADEFWKVVERTVEEELLRP